MSTATVFNKGKVLGGESGAHDVAEAAILLHEDNGGTIVIEQQGRQICLNRESIPELIRELRAISRG